MKVSDIKKIEPLAEVYEFDPEKQYLIYVPPSTNIQAMIARCKTDHPNMGLRAEIIVVDDPDKIIWSERE
jgi:hypothetical protein